MKTDLLRQGINKVENLVKISNRLLIAGVLSMSLSIPSNITAKSEYTIKVRCNIKKSLKKGRYNYIEDPIRENNFGLCKKGRVRIKFFKFGNLRINEIKKAMSDDGFEPATIYELLTVGEKSRKRGSLVALGSKIEDEWGNIFYTFISQNRYGRRIGLDWGWEKAVYLGREETDKSINKILY